MRSLEKAEEIPMLIFDKTIRTIFVSSASVVGWTKTEHVSIRIQCHLQCAPIIIASPGDSSLINDVSCPWIILPIVLFNQLIE